MRLRAYVLAADPAWLETSIQSYYDIVEKIVVSYDRNKVGWTGSALPIDECIDRAKSVDKDKKMEFARGDFAILSNSPMENETRQRREALALAGDADWVLQLDTDEVVTEPTSLRRQLAALPASARCVRWPMRSLFQRAADGRYLEVCTKRGGHVEEYFSIAVRPGTRLAEARTTLDETVPFRSWTLSREVALQSHQSAAAQGDDAALFLGAVARADVAQASELGPCARLRYGALLPGDLVPRSDGMESFARFPSAHARDLAGPSADRAALCGQLVRAPWDFGSARLFHPLR